MKGNLFFAATMVIACLAAYFLGRVYQRSQPAIAPPGAVSPSSSNPQNTPADLGNVIYRDLATISFADLYETLRDATPQLRSEWMEEIVQMPEGSRKISALCGFFRAFVQVDPQTAADLVIKVPRHRGPAMDAMISAAPPVAMHILAEMLLKVPRAARDYELTPHMAIVLDEWAQTDPEAATQFLDAHAEFSFQEYGYSIVEIWAGIDHEASWKWLEAHSDDSISSTVDAWLHGWFAADQQAATNFAFAHVADKKFADAIPSLAPELFKQKEVSAKEFVERLPTLEMRQAALESISVLGSEGGFSECSPSAVAEFFVQFPTTEWPKHFTDVLDTWRVRDLSELVNWISRFPVETQMKIVENFPGPGSDDPERDLLPVLQMPESNLRTQLLRQMVKGLESEHQSAGEAIARLKLAPEQKAELGTLVSTECKP